MKQLLKTTAIAAGAVFVLSGGASALPLAAGQTTCGISDVSGSTACEGAFSGNPSPDIPGETFFGFSDWTEIAKVNGSGTEGVLTVTGGGSSGGWSLTGFDGYGTLMLAVKGGPTFSTYLLGDAANAATSGTWNTDGILTGGRNPKPNPDLSNFSAWGRGTYTPPPVPSPVPLPAAGWMLVAGLGGLAAIRRRRKANA